ncbi:hypothetical protein PROFUN_08026 [Planoprotostelium fungivorum]|uniref:U4/U6.U5 tri-snRNP-associated protein 2-like n=1 Tax=Planoprotostelium fungivorum TaxID=1890364 RepID=A0A2P6NKF3_9EUKA|nr:hypothetical protein PROFUN_08026 [Planoprotostelium fungivorum]
MSSGESLDAKRKHVDEEEEESNYNDLSIQELRSILDENRVDYMGVVEKEELIAKVKNQLKKNKEEGIFQKKKSKVRRDCPYLDTIKRRHLDFDFEKVCSVTLQNLNVYACLVCGKYFQGRGRGSQAYLHSLQANHHVFINLHDERVYCLPDDYEVSDPSLSDIKFVLNPTYTPEQVKKIDGNKNKATSLVEKTEYIPGFVGLNNIKNTDWFNVVIQALIRVVPFRNFFMQEENYIQMTKNPLVTRFGELARKLYNPRNFKAHVDPHELLQCSSAESNKRFTIGQISDPIDYIQWFLSSVHKHLAVGGKSKSSQMTKDSPSAGIVHSVFQGQVQVTTLERKVEVVPFLFLTLEVPPPPLFKDEQERNIIPQRPIFDLLAKFDGRTIKHFAVTGERKTYQLTKLPPYLILHIKRFTKNNFFKEKNPTIVTSPLKNLELKDYMAPGTKYNGSTQYNLVCSIVHDSETNSYRIHSLHKSNNQWYEISDLAVKEVNYCYNFV